MSGPPIRTTNLTDGETVHQRCLLVTGSCTASDNGEDTLSVTTTGVNGIEAFPEQVWPVAGGNFKALVMLSPGSNKLTLTHLHDGNLESSMDINVLYVPLLQYPPLHLVIMAACDSPLVIDCPPHKRGGISSAHSDLDAAIAKFRMTAYMWQAMTAEDFRQKGVGRRSFRLDEEWAPDTVSSEFLNAAYSSSLAEEGAMRATAKVHVIRTSKTTKELRDADIAQQNKAAYRKDDLHAIFNRALFEAGGLFDWSAQAIVAGLILDSHYSPSQDLILGHAALGCHNPTGLSLGIFGSHLTYSWPRFIEEVPQCLLDTRPPGPKVGNDSGECNSMWEACAIGQGAFLHEVGHAFGAPHQAGIMERGYAHDWPKNFLPKTAYCASRKTEGVLVTKDTPNEATWNLRDAFAFRVLPHFRLPTDPLIPMEVRDACVTAEVTYTGEEELNSQLNVSCPAGLVQVTFDGQDEKLPAVGDGQLIKNLTFFEPELTREHDRTKPLTLSVLAYNGKQLKVADVWKLLANTSFIVVPGTSIRLYKRSVQNECLEDRGAEADQISYNWAQLLKERGPGGNLSRAVTIDLRVGACLDGGVVYYADGHKSHWGPMRRGGREHRFGGHASEEIGLQPGVEITRIDINRGRSDDCMDGIRMHLSDGTVKGELNCDPSMAVSLMPGPDEVIVGFYGRSNRNGFTGVTEFGIITAPKDVGLDGLPEIVFDLPELRNTCGLGEDDRAQMGEEDSDEESEDEDDSDDSDD